MDKGHREALQRAARELVREKGLARTTARDLVGASGTNLRSIGYHFGSKDALMAEVLALISEEWTRAPVDAARDQAPTAPPEQRMTAAVRTMLTDLPGKREDLLVYLEGVLEARHSSVLATSLVQTQENALQAIAGSILEATPELPDDIARTLARLLVAVHDGLALEAAVADEPDLHDTESLLLALAGLGITLGAGLGIPGAAEVLRAMLAPPE